MIFKKKNSSKVSEVQPINDDIKNVLRCEKVANNSLLTMISNIKHHDKGDVLTLDITLPNTITNDEVEALHARLGHHLHPYGIQELNFNIHLQSATADQKSARQNVNNQPIYNGINTTQTNTTQNGDAKQHARSNHLPKVTDAMSNSATQSIENRTKQSVAKPLPKSPPKQSQIAPHPCIKHIVVIASGKGGVGKSTTTVNLALALQKLGNKVGVLDADIYGPSIPTMLGVASVRPELENEKFVPIDAYGLAMLSIGSLLDGDNTPVAWRGPKATGALMQLFSQTNWPSLDYLLIDMPPGTGDIQLTLAQRIPVTGAVIVTTPQHIALLDAKKGVEMFTKTDIAVLGIVENMALHTCTNCGHVEAIFGQGGGEEISQVYGVPLLGQLPLASGIRKQADVGVPSIIAHDGQGDDFAQFYMNIAKNIEANIDNFAKFRDDGRIF